MTTIDVIEYQQVLNNLCGILESEQYICIITNTFYFWILQYINDVKEFKGHDSEVTNGTVTLTLLVEYFCLINACFIFIHNISYLFFWLLNKHVTLKTCKSVLCKTRIYSSSANILFLRFVFRLRCKIIYINIKTIVVLFYEKGRGYRTTINRYFSVKVVQGYITALNYTIIVNNRSSSLPKSVNLETDLQCICSCA